MAFTLVSNQIIIARTAGALFNLEVGATNMTSYVAQATAATSVDTFLNSVYTASVGTTSTALVAAELLTNLGIPASTVAGSAGKVATDYIVSQLNAVAYTARGAVVNAMLKDFSNLTSDTVFGTYATTFNTKITNAVTYSTVSTNSDSTFDSVSSTAAAVVGSTFTLTTGTNSFTGTSAADTFDAGISSSSLQTLNSGDSLDGGLGNDTLYAVVTGSVTPAALKSIEDVYITNTTTASTVDFSNATGLSTVTNSASTIGLTLSGLSVSGPAVTVRDTAIAGQVVTFNDVTGSADSATITINNVSSAATLTVAGVETLTLKSDGSATNVLASLTSAAAKTLIITGSQGFTSTAALGSTITTLDASGNTSTATGVTAIMGATGSNTITGSAGNDNFTVVSTGTDSISGGALTDIIWYSTGTWTTADSVDGGTGTDTLRTLAVSQAGIATPTTYNTTLIETLQITDALAASTYTPVNISATATTLNITGNTDNAGATITTGTVLSVTGATIAGPAGSFAIGLGSALTTNVSGVLVAGGTITITDTGTAITDSLTLTNNARPTSAAMLNVYNGAILPISGYETVTINTGAASGVQNTLAAITLTGDQSANTTLNFTGVNAVQLTDTATATIISAAGITAAGTGSTTTTAAFYMAGAPTATTVTGSGGFDVIYGHASSASSVDGGVGNDSVTGGSANDTLIGGTGNDTITSGSGNDSIVAGDGNDAIVMGANLATGDVIDGGAGTDTLSVSAAIAAAAAATISNVEVISFSAAAAQDMTAFLNSGITTLGTTLGTLAITNAQSTLTNIIFGATAAMGTPALTRLVDSTTSDTINLLMTDALVPTFTGLTLTNEEYINLGKSGTDLTASTITLNAIAATQLLSMTVTGSNNHALSLTGNTATTTINASAATGTFSLTANASIANQTITSPLTAASTITGGTGNDSITGGAAADTITAGAGNDTVNAGAGADTIVGGAGVDIFNGGDGTDTYSIGTLGLTDGGTTVSTGYIVNLSSSAVAATTVTVHRGFLAATDAAVPNSDISSIAAGTGINVGVSTTVSSRVDTLSNFENVVGSTVKDFIVGSSSANTFNAGTGADIIVTGSGADTITALTGDSVVASAVALSATYSVGDTITFGSGVDIITDFTVGTDTIDVTTAGAAVTGYGAASDLAASASTYYLSGTYVPLSGLFTVAVDAGGADTIVWDNNDTGNGLTASTSVTVLVGVVSSGLVAGSFT